MLTNYDTAKLSDLEDVMITNCHKTHSQIDLHVEFPLKPHSCPKCGYVTSLVHDYRIRQVKDPPVQGKILFLHYRKRRYHCPACHTHFPELQHIFPKYYRSTNRFAFFLLEQLKSRRSIQDIAQEHSNRPC